MSARFVVRDAFDLTSRGPVLVGDIVDGTIRVGMRLSLPDGTLARIRGVEYADTPSRREYHIGLVLADAPPAAELLVAFPSGTEITLDDAMPPSVVARDAPTCHRAFRHFWFPLPKRFGSRCQAR